MARLQRQRANDGPDGQRITNKAKLFYWEKQDFPEGYRLRMKVNRNDHAQVWEDRIGQRRYDSFRDEWDICSEFGPDDERWEIDPDDDLDPNGYPNVPPPPETEQEAPMDIDDNFDLLFPLEESPPTSNPNPSTSTSPPATTVPPPPSARAGLPRSPAPPQAPSTSHSPPPPSPTPGPPPRPPTPPEQPLFTPDPPTDTEPLTHAAAQQLSPDELVDILVELEPVQYAKWSNPNTFEDVMRFHYGLVYHITSPMPLSDPVSVLGWKAEPVADDLKAMAKHLNTRNRPVLPADVLRVMSQDVQAHDPPRLVRGRYVKGSWNRLPVREGEYFRFTNFHCDNYLPSLVVHDPVVATHILRRWSHVPTLHVVCFLREHGMVHSLYRDRRTFPRKLDLNHHTADMSTRQVSHGWVTVGRPPGVPEYQMYVLQMRAFFQVPYRLRAAMQYGGIIWRIACMFTDTADRSHAYGLDVDSLELGARPLFGEEPSGEVEYWEEVLSEQEEQFIVGMYKDDTNKRPGDKPAHISWWPTPNCWSLNGLETGYWTPTAEIWFERRLNAIQNGSQPPQTAAKFRSSLSDSGPARPSSSPVPKPTV
ncbi:hypothetical protein EIP91_010608 [Steccherinum ochraceum]|uniref:Uncharacterized protein n=1 Tax=Steccherinum ochraceum TaxID=92696 RepID=A0A4R0RCI9_9APHY|nr:hypothetical protein EIP91_010608 [Steccherinum ochraceum]